MRATPGLVGGRLDGRNKCELLLNGGSNAVGVRGDSCRTAQRRREAMGKACVVQNLPILQVSMADEDHAPCLSLHCMLNPFALITPCYDIAEAIYVQPHRLAASQAPTGIGPLCGCRPRQWQIRLDYADERQ